MVLDEKALEEELAKEREALASKIATSTEDETIITMDGVERVKSARELKEDALQRRPNCRPSS